MVQPDPGATLEVVEVQFLLELLVGLLATPARLDGGCQLLQRRVGRMVGQVQLALARETVLTHQPALGPWQVLGP